MPSNHNEIAANEDNSTIMSVALLWVHLFFDRTTNRRIYHLGPLLRRRLPASRRKQIHHRYESNFLAVLSWARGWDVRRQGCSALPMLICRDDIILVADEPRNTLDPQIDERHLPPKSLYFVDCDVLRAGAIISGWISSSGPKDTCLPILTTPLTFVSYRNLFICRTRIGGRVSIRTCWLASMVTPGREGEVTWTDEGVEIYWRASLTV